MSHLVRVECPYCKVKQTLTVEPSVPEEIQWCDQDDVAGCGRSFVTSSVVTVDVAVFRIATAAEVS